MRNGVEFMKRISLQSLALILIRVTLGFMWLSNSLEKWLPSLPHVKWLFNSTGNVLALTQYMIKITPFPWYAALLKLTLHLGPLLTYGVAAAELFFAVTLLTGRGIRWGTLLAMGMLVSLELGWISEEWTFTYLLLIMLHFILFLGTFKRESTVETHYLLRILFGIIWLSMGIHHSVMLVAGLFFIIGFLTPIAALFGIVFSIQVLIHHSLGAWPWVYYSLLVGHIYLLFPNFQSRYSIDRFIPYPKFLQSNHQ